MLSFHNVKCVFEVMCWVNVASTHTHVPTHRQEHSWIMSQTTLKRKDVTERMKQTKKSQKKPKKQEGISHP